MKSKIFAFVMALLLIFSGVLIAAGLEVREDGEKIDSNDGDLDPTVIEATDPPYFAVNIDSTNSPIIEGDTLDVHATINNTGGQTGTQNIELMADGVLRDQTTVTVDSGAEKQVTLRWNTSEGDAGNYMVEVSSSNETVSTSVRILEGPYFSVNIYSTNSPVREGETLNVTATIKNTGDTGETQEIEMVIGGTMIDTTRLTLDPGTEKDVTLSWDTVEGDGGDYTVEISSRDETDSQAITVMEASTFEVTIDSTNSPVTEGDVMNFHVTITNTGEKSGAQEIELMIEDQTIDMTEVNLDPGEDSSVILTWVTGEGDLGNHTAQISSDDDSDRTSVQVEPKRYTLNITVEGEGTLKVDGVEMTAPYEEAYDNGTTIDLEAISADGWQFEGWEGDISEEVTGINVTMDENKSITLRFTEEEDDGGGGDSPGFTSVMLLSAVLLAVAIWYKRKR